MAKSSANHDDFMKQIKERVDQVINAKIESDSGKVDVKNLLAIATTSYMVSLETVMDAHGDNVEDKQEVALKRSWNWEMNTNY